MPWVPHVPLLFFVETVLFLLDTGSIVPANEVNFFIAYLFSVMETSNHPTVTLEFKGIAVVSLWRGGTPPLSTKTFKPSQFKVMWMES